MTVLKKLNSHFARYFSYFQFILYLSSCEALIAVLTTVWPIKALSNSVVFTKPWDFEKDSFRLLHSQEATELPKKPCRYCIKYFSCIVTKLLLTLLSGLLFLVATVNCSELINKLHRILQSVTRFTPVLNGKQESRVHGWVTSIFLSCLRPNVGCLKRPGAVRVPFKSFSLINFPIHCD